MSESFLRQEQDFESAVLKERNQAQADGQKLAKILEYSLRG